MASPTGRCTVRADTALLYVAVVIILLGQAVAVPLPRDVDQVKPISRALLSAQAAWSTKLLVLQDELEVVVLSGRAVAPKAPFLPTAAVGLLPPLTPGPAAAGSSPLQTRVSSCEAPFLVEGPQEASGLHLVTPSTKLLMPVRSAPRDGCVVYEPGYSDTLTDVAQRVGLSADQLLKDNVGSVATPDEPLAGRVLLLCNVTRAVPAAAAPSAGGQAPPPAAQAAPTNSTPAAVGSGAGPLPAVGSTLAGQLVLVVTPAPAPAPPPVEPAQQLVRPASVQEAALLAIKAAVDPKGKDLQGWSPALASYCQWVNVLCDAAGNVVRVTLSYLDLQGTLPPASALLDLPRLEALLLAGNSLKGALPPGYSRTRLREIYVNDNQLTGELPQEWASGPLATTLRELSVAFNQISGRLPPQWGAFTALRTLKLSSNRFTGSVPPQWAAPSSPYMASLEAVSLFINPGLTGCVPAAFAAPGPSGRGPVLVGLSGKPTADPKVAGRDTKITGLCRR